MKIKEEIGTVEPIGYFKDGEVSECLAFVRGAIERYVSHEEYHESLFRYIKKMVDMFEKTDSCCKCEDEGQSDK